MSKQDKITGMIFGCLLGDSLGAPFEFHTTKTYTGKMDCIERTSRFGGDKKIGVAGQITDDSEMMMALAYSILKNNKYDREEAIKQYLLWANSRCNFMGKNTRNLFNGVKTIKGYESRYNKIYTNDNKEEWSQSNGCLMRSCPLALLKDDDYIKFVKEDCCLTNPSLICVESVCVYITLLKNLLNGASRKKAFTESIKHATQKIVLDAINDGIKRKERNVKEQKGWVLHALYCVFYSLSGNCESFSESINEIIYLGGDTDTNGAICGAPLGIYFGYKNMFENDKDTQENINIIINCDVEKGGMKRPVEYTTKNINKLIKDLIKFNE